MQPLVKVEIGEAAKQDAAKMIKDEQHNGMLIEMIFFSMQCGAHAKNLPLGSGLLRAVHCLILSEWTKTESEWRIKRLAHKMLQVIADSGW
jgi:hypothetical protein